MARCPVGREVPSGWNSFETGGIVDGVEEKGGDREGVCCLLNLWWAFPAASDWTRERTVRLSSEAEHSMSIASSPSNLQEDKGMK